MYPVVHKMLKISHEIGRRKNYLINFFVVVWFNSPRSICTKMYMEQLVYKIKVEMWTCTWDKIKCKQMQGIGNKGQGCNKNLILMKKKGKTEPKKNQKNTDQQNNKE